MTKAGVGNANAFLSGDAGKARGAKLRCTECRCCIRILFRGSAGKGTDEGDASFIFLHNYPLGRGIKKKGIKKKQIRIKKNKYCRDQKRKN